MLWIFTGYLISYLIAASAYFGHKAIQHPIDLTQLAFCFLVVPVGWLIFGVSEVFVIDSEARRAIKERLHKGKLSRKQLIIAGALVGLIVIGFVVGFCYSVPQDFLLFAALASLIPILFAPTLLVMYYGFPDGPNRHGVSTKKE